MGSLMNYVFIRGLARNKEHWYGFEKRFYLGSHVIMLDIPGNGELNQLTSPLTIKECTNFLRKQFLSLKKDETYTLVGISLGGMIATDWLNRFEDDFEKVIVINMSAKNLALPWQRFHFKMFLQIPFLLFSNERKIEKSILNTTLNMKKPDNQLLEKALLILKHFKTSKINLFRQLIAASQFHFPLDIKSQKMIVIFSENDRLVSSISSKKIIQKLKCRYFIHQHAGHDLPLDDPEWLFQIICGLVNDD